MPPAPIEWQIDIPLLNNRFIWWDFLKVGVLSPLIMWASVALMGWILDGEPVLLPWWLLMISGGALMALLALSSLLLGNRHGAYFGVSEDGIGWAPGSREARINAAVAGIGALAGSASTAGAGLLAQANQQGLFEWSEVRRLKVHPRQRVISAMNSWRVVIRLYCPPELFDEVVSACEAHLAAAREAALLETQNAGPVASSRPYGWPWRIGMALLTLVLTVCTQAWYWIEVDHEATMRLALLGGALIAGSVLIEGPLRRVFALAGIVGAGLGAWALIVSALDPITVPNLDPSLGTLETTSVSATLDTPMLVLAGASIAGLLVIAAWRAFGRGR